MFLSKVQQSYCYTQLWNYKQEFVFKPVSTQFNIAVDCNLNFTESLIAFYLKMDAIILNAIREFVTSFSPLTLHVVNLML